MLVVILASCTSSVPPTSGHASLRRTPDYLARQGRELYALHCTACHMEKGTGIPGAFPPLAGAPILQARSELIKSVLFPRPGTAMPSYCLFHAEEIAAILTYVRGAWQTIRNDPIRSEDVLQVIEENPNRPCSTLELSRVPLPETLLSFSLGWLKTQEIIRLATIRAIPTGTGVSGAIVERSDRTLYLVQSYPWPDAPKPAAPAAGQGGLPASLLLLPPCAASRLAAQRGRSGWQATASEERPHPRYANVHELKLLDGEQVRDARAALAGRGVAFLNDELRAHCERVLEQRYLW